MLDHEIIVKFKEFQKKTGKYLDLIIEDVRFEKVFLSNSEYFELNPKKSEIDDKVIKDNILVSFVPLPSINEEHGIMNTSTKRNIQDVKKGYTYFKEGDVIFTKVTPSMENGNFAIATNLHNGIGFGSSEYYVFRCKKVYNKFLWSLFRADFFKNRAHQVMRGAGGLKRVPLEFFDTQYIPIPKKLNEKYISLELQKIIVEFLEHGFDWLDGIKANIDKQDSIYKRLRKSLIPSTFKKDYIKVRFAKYAKKYDIDFNIIDVEFETKRIHADKKDKDDLICSKKMGFTPETDSDGDINWFSVKDLGQVDGLFINNPKTNKKTTMKLIKKTVDKKDTGKSEKLIAIKKGDILISFKLTVGVVKIYNSNKPSYCNEAIDVLTVSDGIYNKYVAYNSILEYPKYGTRTNNGVTLNDDSKKEIKIFIPKSLKKYTSYKIQKIIADFINEVDDEIEQSFDKINKGYDAVKRYKRAYLYKTFSKINWSK